MLHLNFIKKLLNKQNIHYPAVILFYYDLIIETLPLALLLFQLL